MAYQTRRYSYDDDSSSAQNLWIIVLVVGAMVGSFVFGRYVLGDRLRRDAAPMRDVAEEPSLGQPAPLGGSAYAQVPTTPLDQDANAVTGTAPEDVSIVSAETEAQLDGQMPAATRQLEQAMTDPPQDREAERLRAERERQQAEAERKKREEEERRRSGCPSTSPPRGWPSGSASGRSWAMPSGWAFARRCARCVRSASAPVR